MQYASGILLPPVQTLVATLIFAFGENAKNPSHSAIKGLQKKISPQKNSDFIRVFLFLWVKFLFTVYTYNKDIFLNTDLNPHNIAIFKEHRKYYAPFFFSKRIDFLLDF